MGFSLMAASIRPSNFCTCGNGAGCCVTCYVISPRFERRCTLEALGTRRSAELENNPIGRSEPSAPSRNVNANLPIGSESLNGSASWRVRTLMHRLHSLQTTQGTFQSNLRSLVATNAFSFFSDNTPATVRRRRSSAVAFCSLFAILPQGGKSYCRHKMQKMLLRDKIWLL